MKTDKVILIASTFKHLRAFHIPYIEMLQKNGVEVDAAANEIQFATQLPSRNFEIPISRSPFSVNNISAIYALWKILKSGEYRFIHCHTAMGSVVARIAALLSYKRPKVIYTAHGFHFFKGGPIKNWLLYFPIEWLLSFATDLLITINDEDYLLAEKKFFQKKVIKVNGIGVDISRFNPLQDEEKLNIRSKLGLAPKDFVLIYAAEYIPRKNHDFLVSAMQKLVQLNPDIKLLLAGRGKDFDKIKDTISQKNLSKNIIQLGFISNIHEYYAISDLGISTSKQEGLGLNLIEELLSGIPVIASMDRGHKEVVVPSANGFLYPQGDLNYFIQRVEEISTNQELMSTLKLNARNTALKFDLNLCLSIMDSTYNQFLKP